ncbi:hypothetical protein L486_08017 [Kwoniella mangroviensis CBS 10435]|uniref:Calcineurin-like phosphoesterase domain-containing protein n=1 Tax=Kwoniella mangroviensis CBS 10435 TaxID=1331196 RepID=A0A1B9IFQ3_9TREE|nr:uncharacterized protein I203_01028 [Kwoniella mangroviensis CBS 8507]OCF54469.1 hypothetical protein L486_08017 [Kwoniella mangroviensis CBS 10435]OCF69174.1 hypothetical protein I203_01028 [Kwoniella mangroviensis CBS 8507]
MLDSPRLRSPSLGPPNEKGITPSGKRRSGLRSRGTQLLALKFGWVVLVIWFEVGDFFHSLSTCRFPDSSLRRSNPHLKSAPTHVVLLADPHVPHPVLSYSEDSKPWVNWLKQQIDELFMRKSWNVVTRLGRIDAVIVLGDMLDCGRGVMSDDEYEEYYNLFRSIFQLPPSVPTHFVPGNHDIPLGPNRLFSPHARDRYAKHFSPPNAILPIANHSLIMLDAVGLVEEDYRRYAAEMQFGEWDGVEGGVIEFVKELGDNPPPGPKILISHIPLARPEASTCGPLRERGRILKGAGPGYQNLLGSETSRFLLEALQPSIVFSGDDHDYCEHRHPQGIREVTIKSFSSSTGIRRPGFQLLSLVPPQPNGYAGSVTHADRPCLLPDQSGSYYRVYLPLAILTFLFLFGTNIRAAWQRWSGSSSKNGGGGSYYGDLKSRLSPGILSSETMPSSNNPGNPSLSTRRGMSDRPVPLTLPSRKSSHQLAGMGSTTATPGLGPNGGGARRFPSNPTSTSASAPVSPFASPRMSFVDEHRPNFPSGSGSSFPSGLTRMDEDPELGQNHSQVFDPSSPTPSVSRRSSYIYMNDNKQHQPSQQYGFNDTPGESGPPGGSYFLPLPGTGNGNASQTAGLGFTTPMGSTFPLSGSSTGGNAQQLRRVSSSTYSLASHNLPTGGGLISPAPIRRVTMPRLLSTNDWTSAASKKDKSLFNFVLSPNGRGGLGGLVDTLKRFVIWMWKARNGVVAKSWKEVWAVAWPAGIVWVLVNALFFLK